MAAKWIAGAVKHPGALTRKAKAAGEGTQEFAREHEHDSGTTGKQARLAVTFSHMHHHTAAKHKAHAEYHRKRAAEEHKAGNHEHGGHHEKAMEAHEALAEAHGAMAGGEGENG